MEYLPFFDMNILVSADSLAYFSTLVGFLILFHVVIAVYLIFRFVYLFKKSGLRLAAPRI